jgi:hypothetical protein
MSKWCCNLHVRLSMKDICMSAMIGMHIGGKARWNKTTGKTKT